MANDTSQALEDIIACGFERVLTSGGRSTALEGVPVLKSLIKQVPNIDIFIIIFCI